MTQTREALSAYSGQAVRNWAEGGPFAKVAAELLERFASVEAARLEHAEARAAVNGPVADALVRFLEKARQASLENSPLPVVSRFDAYQVVKAQSTKTRRDRGLKLCAAHLMRLWRDDPEGTLAVGDLARLRAHYGRAHPRSKVRQVLDAEIPKVAFTTLPVRELAHAAAAITDQASYEETCRALGVDGRRPDQVRARAYLRGLVAISAPEAEPDDASRVATARAEGSAGAASRTIARLASDADPTLRTVAMDPDADADADAGADMYGADLDPGMPPHDEANETSIEVMSPNSGEPMLLELAPLDDDAGGATPVTPEYVASLMHFGQLSDFEGSDEMPDEEPDAGGPSMLDDRTETSVPDPTAPGKTIDVLLAPGDNAMSAPAPASVASALVAEASAVPEHWAVFVVRGGFRAGRPIDGFTARGMPRALSELGRRLGTVDADAPFRAEVRAPPEEFSHRALVVTDAAAGEYLYLAAASDAGVAAADFEPKINPQQPNDAVKVPEDGVQALEAEHFGPSSGSGYKTAGAGTCAAAAPFTALEVEAALVDEGRKVTAGTWALRITDDGDLEVTRDRIRRTASLAALDQEVGELVEHAGRVARGEVPEAALRSDLRPFIVLGCARCGSLSSYIQPDQAAPLACGCGYTSSPEEVAAQLFSRRDAAPPGYFLVTDLPGEEGDAPLQARRVLAGIREVIPAAVGAISAGRLEVELPSAGPAELARIHRVLADRFGIRAETAPGQPSTPGTPGALPVGVLPQPGQQPAPAAPGPGLAPMIGPGGPGAAQGVGQPPAPLMPPAPGGAPRKASRAGGAGRAGRAGRVLDPGNQGESGPGPGRVPLLFHAAVRGPDGKMQTIPVAAADPRAAYDLLAPYVGQDAILGIKAQLAPFPVPDDVPLADDGPAAGLGLVPAGAPPALGGMGGEVPPQVQDAIAAAMTTYRNTGMSIDAAIDEFRSQFKALLASFGDEGSAARQTVGAVIVKAAQDAWSKPALLVAAGRRVAVPDRTAPAAGMPTPSKVNPQHGPYVPVPGDAGQVLGSDSAQGHPAPAPKGKLKAQPKPQGTFAEPSWKGHQEGTQSAFPATPKPKGKVPPSPGTSYSTPAFGDGPPAEHGTGDNKTTKSWDAVSHGAKPQH